MGLSLTMVQVSVHEIISGEEPEQSPGIISSSPLRARDCPASYSGNANNVKSGLLLIIYLIDELKEITIVDKHNADLVVDLVHSIVEIVTCSDRQDMQIFEYAFPLKL
ncbi:hypothetical protein LINPERHAP1_LOCUS23717 [Linum perenne]